MGEPLETSASTARLWLAKASLLATTALISFVLVAPILGYPMDFSDAMRLGELVFPVFFGYLGSATAFLVAPGKDLHVRRASDQLFALLLKGPIVVFCVGTVLALIAFGYTNGSAAAAGTGMSIETLAAFVSVFLGLLTITTNALAAKLFTTSEAPRGPS
jgi:hypothetical protein